MPSFGWYQQIIQVLDDHLSIEIYTVLGIPHFKIPPCTSIYIYILYIYIYNNNIIIYAVRLDC